MDPIFNTIESRELGIRDRGINTPYLPTEANTKGYASALVTQLAVSFWRKATKKFN